MSSNFCIIVCIRNPITEIQAVLITSWLNKILELMDESKGGSGGHISPYNSVIYRLYKESSLDESPKFPSKMGNLFPRGIDRSLRILGFHEDRSIGDAKRVYDQITGEGGIPSALVYVSLIHGFCLAGHVREAFELMNETVGRGYFPIASTFNVLISGFCRQGKVGSASKLMEDMIGRGCLPKTGSYSPLMDALSLQERGFPKGFNPLSTNGGKGYSS